MTRPIAALLTLAGILSASEANAQHVPRRGHGHKAASYVSPAPSISGASSFSTMGTFRPNSCGDNTQSPLPAGTSVGNGADEFPFHGQPYGRPYDRWTWSTLSGSYGQGLARYYDPPVK